MARSLRLSAESNPLGILLSRSSFEARVMRRLDDFLIEGNEASYILETHLMESDTWRTISMVDGCSFPSSPFGPMHICLWHAEAKLLSKHFVM